MSDLVKYCRKCQVEKPLEAFHKQTAGRLGRRPDCKECRGHPPRKKNAPGVREAYLKAWRKAHADELRVYARERQRVKRKEDPQHKLRDRLRGRIGKAVKQDRRPGSAVKDLGCTIGEFKIYLESKFKPGMDWNNYGPMRPGFWQIDHILPLMSFDLTDVTQFRQAVHYTNMQPLWYEEHLEKSKQDLDLNRLKR